MALTQAGGVSPTKKPPVTVRVSWPKEFKKVSLDKEALEVDADICVMLYGSVTGFSVNDYENSISVSPDSIEVTASGTEMEKEVKKYQEPSAKKMSSKTTHPYKMR